MLDTHDHILSIKDSINVNDSNADAELELKLKVVGTCQILEKRFYRLTEIPDPSSVRPLAVLKKALPLVMAKYANGSQVARYL